MSEQKSFNVYVEHNHGYSEATVKAESIQEALEKAKALPDENLFFVSHFEPDESRQMIRVTDEETDEELECQIEETFASILSAGLKRAIAALNMVPSFRTDEGIKSYALVSELEELIREL